jgi:hypothetical protein
LDIASLGNNAMPKLFDHVGEHHPDQNFIFDQEYGCLAEHFSGRLWRYRKRFCSSRKLLAHPVHRPIIRFFTSVAKAAIGVEVRRRLPERWAVIRKPGAAVAASREQRV